MNIYCLKEGSFYSAEYVNILAYRCALTTPGIDRFVCYTDNTAGIDSHIECRCLPQTEEPITGWWYKPLILRDAEPGENIYIDLDMLVTGDLSVYVHNGEGIRVLHNRVAGINSSVIGWNQPIVEPARHLLSNLRHHVDQPRPYGDQEIFEQTAAAGRLKIFTYPPQYTAWLGRIDRQEQPISNWNEHTRTVVCKGDRKPHRNTHNTFVKKYWSRPC